MPLTIQPQLATMFPFDQLSFAVAGQPPPSGWRTITNATIEADGRLQIVTAPGTATGYLMHVLQSGFGELVIKIDEGCICTGAGTMSFTIEDENAVCSMEVSIEDNRIDIALTNMTGDDGTTALALADGDLVKIELQGITWIVSHIAAADGAVTVCGYGIGDDPFTYPLYVLAGITPPVVSAPAHILPVELTGDWQIKTSDIDWTIEVGTLTAAVFNTQSIDYAADDPPGSYLLTAVIAGSDYQTATAVVTVPPVMILGPRVIEVEPLPNMQPGTIQLRSNYEAAQENLLVWTAVTAGGTITNSGLYTYSTVPGDYVVRLTSVGATNNQKDEIIIRVLTVLQPPPQFFPPSTAVVFKTNMTGTVSWSAAPDIGLTPSTGQTSTGTMPSTVGTRVTVTVDNGTLTRLQNYQVVPEIELDYSLPYQATVGPDVLIDYPQSGRDPFVRQLSQANFIPETIDLSIVNVDYDDYASFVEFHDEYFKAGKVFFITNVGDDSQIMGRFDSKLSVEVLNSCQYNISFKFKKA